jgi:hypothetical protein
MFRNLRSTWLAGSGAALLVLSMSGLVAAATVSDDTTSPTIATFEDLNGNGIDDDCETAVVESPDAVTTAMAAVDANADGVISTTEAAHSSWVGGLNCNHGGYVSTVAHSAVDTCDGADAPEGTTAETTDETKDESEDSNEGSDDVAIETSTGTAPVAADCSQEAPAADEADATKDAARAACEAALAAGTPVVLPVMTHVQLAQSDLVGGKNCNHGGAVSDANKAAKAERDAAKLAAREARLAAHAAKSHGKHGKHGQN